MKLDHFLVLIPDEYGELLVCPLDQLVAAVMAASDGDREALLETIGNDCAIDSFKPSDEQIAKVRAFDETGDAWQFWNERG